MKIFISYRRDDSSGYAGRLFDHLAAHFGEKNVFIDIDTIVPGDDFRKVVQNAVGTCDVVLVMIGKQWLNITDDKGQRRLDSPRDWVRMEVAHALANPEVRVIPVLIQNAAMPDAQKLPEDLRELSYRNAIELSDSRFQHDANRLIEVIEQKKSPLRFLKIALGIFALVLVLGMVGYAIKMMLPSGTATPAATLPSTNVPASTWTPMNTWTPSPIPSTSIPTSTASPTPSPTSTLVPVSVLSAEIRTMDQYYKYVNNAVKYKDLNKAWDLLTKKYQCSANDCKLTGFQDWWWSRKVHYKLYDCGSATVDTELVYYNRDPMIPVTPTVPIHLRYWLVKDHGQLKIDAGSLIEEPAAGCKLVVSVE